MLLGQDVCSFVFCDGEETRAGFVLVLVREVRKIQRRI